MHIFTKVAPIHCLNFILSLAVTCNLVTSDRYLICQNIILIWQVAVVEMMEEKTGVDKSVREVL